MTFVFDWVRLPDQPCLNHDNVHVRLCPITRASMPKPLIALVFQVCSVTRTSIRLCSTARAYQNIHATQNTIILVLQAVQGSPKMSACFLSRRFSGCLAASAKQKFPSGAFTTRKRIVLPPFQVCVAGPAFRQAPQMPHMPRSS